VLPDIDDDVLAQVCTHLLLNAFYVSTDLTFLVKRLEHVLQVQNLEQLRAY
jgi:hypothetical protein